MGAAFGSISADGEGLTVGGGGGGTCDGGGGGGGGGCMADVGGGGGGGEIIVVMSFERLGSDNDAVDDHARTDGSSNWRSPSVRDGAMEGPKSAV